MQSYDVIFAGGGVMGCAIAYHLLKADPTLSVAIVEKDPSYAQSSTVLSDGNMRVQFNVKENVLMSLYGLAMVERMGDELAVGDDRPDPLFRREGNLFLADAAGLAAAQEGVALQQSLGAAVEWLAPEAVLRRYPFINPEGLAGGAWGANDGTMDPTAVLMAYKHKSIALGAEYVVGEVAGATRSGGRASGVTLRSGQTLAARYVVNSAGAWGVDLARSVGVALPIAPTMRHVFHLEGPVSSDTVLPLIVFPSGLYLHHEHGNHFICGKSLTVDPVSFDFTFKRSLFVDHVWEDLAACIPDFERVKVVGGWAGLYAVNTFDGNAILGEWPELPGFIIVGGFSGHGFQQCHAVGAYLADVILGREPALDLGVFSPRRILENQPIFENAGRLI